MEQEFILKGLDCAHCAAKIEATVTQIPGIVSANVNFAAGKLYVETQEKLDRFREIKSEIQRIEPNIVVIDNNQQHDHDHSSESNHKELSKLVIGAVIFIIGFLLDHFTAVNPTIVLAIYVASYLLLGGEILIRAFKNIVRGQIFDENFLMVIATIGAFAIKEYPEAVAVMLFYQIGEYFQSLAVQNSKRSITSLLDIRPDSANLKTADGTIQKVSPEEVPTGATILVKPGERIPLDGIVLEGQSMLDTSALTGESVPRKVTAGDTILSGCINQTGVLTIEVTKSYGQSTVAKIIDLVEHAASKKAPTENFITTFAKYYTPVVVILATLIAVLPPLITGGNWPEWINRSLIFLVISCPCALVISIPLGFFGGIGAASRKGILIKGSNYLEALNNLDIVVFDKTGTLTKGVFAVSNVTPANGLSSEQLLALAAQVESFSSHPIALSILKAYGKTVDQTQLSDYQELAGLGIRVLAGNDVILAGNQKLMEQYGVPVPQENTIGTHVYLAVNHTYAGCITISDEIKPDSATAIDMLKERGIRKTVMLTGDNPAIAKEIAGELHLDTYYGGLLPDQKVEKVEQLDSEKRPKGKLAFVGDGINDAPVLARADIGIAMGGLGSDAAIEAADIVLMTDEPTKLAEAVDIAKTTKRIVWQNIVFALSIKGAFLLLGALGVATMWEAVFADVGVSVLAILNSTRVLKQK